MRHLLPVILAAGLAVFGSSSLATERPGSSQEDERVIREIDAGWSKALHAKDLDTVMGVYTEDAAFLVPNLPIIKGKAGIRAWFEQRIAQPGYSATFKPTQIVVSSSRDIAYELGTFRVEYLDSNGTLVYGVGKHLVTWEKQGGQWKVTAEAISSDSATGTPVR